MAVRNDVGRLRRDFSDAQRHRLLNRVSDALSAELLEYAHLEMPAPTGKVDSGDRISMRLVFTGGLSERDQQAVRTTMQRLKNLSELKDAMRRSGRQ